MRTVLANTNVLKLVCVVSSLLINTVTVGSHLLTYNDHTPLLIVIAVASQSIISALCYYGLSKYLRIK